jgi:aquaporin Z
MQRYIAEFLGTFFLVLVIALTGNPIAIGAILVAMVYMGGYMSGAHYNPAVTLAVLMRRKIEPSYAARYILVQLLGGFAAALVAFAVTGLSFTPAPTADFLVSLMVEILFTFALASVVLHVAATDDTEGNQYYGLAIGLTVMAAAFAGGPISGGVYNPAVAVGPLLLDIGNIGSNLGKLALYIIGPLMGGALAATVYRVSKREEEELVPEVARETDEALEEEVE